MDKKYLITGLAANLRTLADSLLAVAEGMPDSVPDETGAPQRAVSLEEVRAALAKKSNAGFTDEVRGLLQKYGAAKLSEIDQSKFALLLADAEGLK